jgi:hypothetical protein
MYGSLSLRPRCYLRPALDSVDSGGYGGGSSSGGGGSSYTPVYSQPVYSAPAPAPSSAPRYDLSPQSIQQAVARGNTQSDIQSAYQTFLTGTPVGRGGQYAVSAQQKYGFASLRDAAASYLDAAGLRRLAEEIVSIDTDVKIDVEDKDDDSGLVTNDKNGTTGKGNPFATVADLVGLFERVFATSGASDTPAPVVVVGDTTEGQASGGSSVGIILVVLAIGAGAFYWFYWRKRNG